MNDLSSRRSFFRRATGGAAGAALLSTFGTGMQNAVNAQSSASNPSDLKITKISTAYMDGHGTHLFVKLETNQGIVGYGEGMDAVRGTQGLLTSPHGWDNWVQHLVGQNPLDVNVIFERIRQQGFFAGAQGGIFISALTAVEYALWDLAGKALNVPVYRLLGGKFRDKIRIYCDTASSSEEPAEMARAAQEVVDYGFTAIKFDLDWNNDPHKWDPYNSTANNRELDRMMAQMTAVREQVGYEFDLCVDMHGNYDTTTGVRAAKMLEPIRLMWLEEPVPAENLDAYREINEHTTTPICLGENHYLAHDFRRALEKKACDIIMPDLHKCGGIAEGQRIANLANLYYVPMAPHMVASPLGAMGACHCCAAVPNFLCLEWHWISRWERWNELIEEEPLIKDGYITVSDKPGIGVTLIEDAVKKTAVPEYPFFA
jgi:galactonate dehydratase